MSTFSTSLKLELPADGSQVGTWGQTTNNNIGTLLEQAITGIQSITMLDANYTLTNLNGVSDEARNAVIIAQGTNTAVRDIIAPLVNKLYYVVNNTTGGFNVRITGASGTAVSVPSGLCVPVYCDGTNFYSALNGTVGNFIVTGNESITGTLSVNGNLGGSTANFSGAISSVSPAFTGVPTAPTASPGTNTTQIATTAFVAAVAGSLGLWHPKMQTQYLLRAARLIALQLHRWVQTPMGRELYRHPAQAAVLTATSGIRCNHGALRQKQR